GGVGGEEEVFYGEGDAVQGATNAAAGAFVVEPLGCSEGRLAGDVGVAVEGAVVLVDALEHAPGELHRGGGAAGEELGGVGDVEEVGAVEVGAGHLVVSSRVLL